MPMTKVPPTERDLNFFERQLIAEARKMLENQESPYMSELCRRVGLSYSHGHRLIKNLARHGVFPCAIPTKESRRMVCVAANQVRLLKAARSLARQKRRITILNLSAESGLSEWTTTHIRQLLINAGKWRWRVAKPRYPRTPNACFQEPA